MRTLSPLIVATCAALLSCAHVLASPACPEEQTAADQGPPADLTLCRLLDPIVRTPNARKLNDYETALNSYVDMNCHRNLAGGWAVDKRIRDTGPWVGTYRDNAWTGAYNGTHQPVLVWYSPEMYQWLKANRPVGGTSTGVPAPPGAIIVKEMYTAPAAACAGIDWKKLKPTVVGMAVMVRDAQTAYDGWFWSAIGWAGWKPDWPAAADNPLPFSGFGQYCTNCHASARDNHTFAALENIAGEAGEPLVFLSQDFFIDPSWRGLHARITHTPARESVPLVPLYDPEFVKLYWISGGRPTREQVGQMPSQTYDNAWVKAAAAGVTVNAPTVDSQYVTSDQCLGCHSAGGTGLQYDMTMPGTATKLINLSPYGTWRDSPMGLAGRDPIFFAQLASETETFHHNSRGDVQDICLGCHGILGQRQAAIDGYTNNQTCGQFTRDLVDAVPYPIDNPSAPHARYGALARDGISCAACHRMVLGKADEAKYRDQVQNKCIEQRQQALNPDLTGFARSFTGSFLVGPPDRFFGPFADPKKKPMKHAIGSDPEPNTNVLSSELCGSCHTVHLPVLHRDQTIRHVYEQTTYPEWAFSAYRTGSTPDGPLPFGPGMLAESCQGCHMPNKDAQGGPYRSKIAAIQEYSNFPQAEHTLPPQDIDLPTRSGFAQHTLVGLNVFLLKMAWQFPDVLGIRQVDPMLGSSKGIASIPTSEGAMLDQAANKTATVTVPAISTADNVLKARVTVINKAGHKFPSGVGFRRAFLQFNVLDKDNKVLWSSGRTDRMGVIVDEKGVPVAGELWWTKDCSERINPDARIHQPHYEEITRQDQVQIYEELVSTPANVDAPVCGPDAKPQGQLTTSFLSICTKVKDNRLLPQGFLKLDDRIQISQALGADVDMARESGPEEVGDDPDYVNGGGDSLEYRIPMGEIPGKPAAVEATLYYQATPPSFLQDRFCTSGSTDAKRLYYLGMNVKLSGPTEHWKLRVVTSGPVAVPQASP